MPVAAACSLEVLDSIDVPHEADLRHNTPSRTMRCV
jgi:hypothetical protein